MDRHDTIRSIARRYQRQSLWLTVALSLLTLLVMNLTLWSEATALSMVIMAVYTLIATGIHASWWTAVATRRPERLGRFYLASSALRMVCTVVVLLLLVVNARRTASALPTAAIVTVFYLATLTFDCIYFARVEKKNEIK